jgi:hypothetical protein
MLDPFAELADHNMLGCVRCADPDYQSALTRGEPSAMMEQSPLDERRQALAALPPEPGHWPNAASLARIFDPPLMDRKMLARFELKIKPQQIDWHTPCWLWTGGTHDKGYGRFWLGLVDNKRVHAYSHRIAFEHWVGMPPLGYIVDHMCNHKLCCNPTHTWPETNENNLRLADQRRPWKRRNQYSKE